MYSDTHLHSYFSGDSETPPPEQIEKAIALGMETMCFTDHDDHDVVSDIDFELKIPEYIAEMRSLKEQYSGRIEILTGIELGLKTDIPDHLREVGEYKATLDLGEGVKAPFSVKIVEEAAQS